MKTHDMDGMVEFAGGGALVGKAMLDSAVVAYYEDMHRAVRRRGLDPALTTEVVHDLYLHLSRRPERLAGKASWRAYLIRAAVNLGIDRLRRIVFERRLFAALDGDVLQVADRANCTEARLLARERIELLKTAIRELPGQCRNVFVAYHIAGLSKDEVSDGLGMKRRMVDRHLRKAVLHCLERIEGLD